jgi:integrase
MPRPRHTIPAYRKHKKTGRAAVSIYRADGSRTEILLPGEFGSEQSKAEFERLLCQLRANAGSLPEGHVAKDITIAELVLKFLDHAESYYVDAVSKQPTSEIAALRAAVRPLLHLYADIPALEFGPLALQSLRAAMVSGSWLSDGERAARQKSKRPIGLARSTANKYINRIKLVFKWAASMELIPTSLPQSLSTVAGLRRGRTSARETKTVKPIASAVIDETLPHLPPVVRDMVTILLLTGMRCGELCVMRSCDLEMSHDIWLFRPERHKGQWLGKERVIAIGPKCQDIIRRYFVADNMTAYLFSPAAQDELIQAARRAKRKTPLWPSHMARNVKKKKASGKRRPGNRFQVRAVNRAIRAACKRAGVDRWHTHQLRHSASLAFTRELGLEAARAALGHASVDVSAMYAGQDIEIAKKVAERIG